MCLWWLYYVPDRSRGPAGPGLRCHHRFGSWKMVPIPPVFHTGGFIGGHFTVLHPEENWSSPTRLSCGISIVSFCGHSGGLPIFCPRKFSPAKDQVGAGICRGNWDLSRVRIIRAGNDAFRVFIIIFQPVYNSIHEYFPNRHFFYLVQLFNFVQMFYVFCPQNETNGRIIPARYRPKLFFKGLGQYFKIPGEMKQLAVRWN